jgi:hypothetical protein
MGGVRGEGERGGERAGERAGGEYGGGEVYGVEGGRGGWGRVGGLGLKGGGNEIVRGVLRFLLSDRGQV